MSDDFKPHPISAVLMSPVSAQRELKQEKSQITSINIKQSARNDFKAMVGLKQLPYVNPRVRHRAKNEIFLSMDDAQKSTLTLQPSSFNRETSQMEHPGDSDHSLTHSLSKYPSIHSLTRMSSIKKVPLTSGRIQRHKQREESQGNRSHSSSMGSAYQT
jgi:hypothetical protein